MSIVYLILCILSMAAAIAVKVMFVPASDGIDISGAHVFFTVKMPIQDLPITEAQVNSWCVILAVMFLCLFLTTGLKTRNISIRQMLAEWIVEKVTGLVRTNMGEYFEGFAPFIAAILGLSGFSSLSSLLGLFPPTSDINIIAGWAILVFFLITYYKMKAGPWIYLKSFGQPQKRLIRFDHIGTHCSRTYQTVSQPVLVPAGCACRFPLSEDRYSGCAVDLF